MPEKYGFNVGKFWAPKEIASFLETGKVLYIFNLDPYVVLGNMKEKGNHFNCRYNIF